MTASARKLAEAEARLDLRVWLRLFACTNLIEGHVRRKLREEFASTLPRFDLLAQLYRAPDGLTMGELSRRLMVSNGNVTGLIDRLVGEGLVERTADADDRRVSRVRLTDDGRGMFARMAPAHHGWVAEMMAGLGRDDEARLFDLLGRLKGSITDFDQEPKKDQGGDDA